MAIQTLMHRQSRQHTGESDFGVWLVNELP